MSSGHRRPKLPVRASDSNAHPSSPSQACGPVPPAPASPHVKSPPAPPPPPRRCHLPAPAHSSRAPEGSPCIRVDLALPLLMALLWLPRAPGVGTKSWAFTHGWMRGDKNTQRPPAWATGSISPSRPPSSSLFPSSLRPTWPRRGLPDSQSGPAPPTLSTHHLAQGLAGRGP